MFVIPLSRNLEHMIVISVENADENSLKSVFACPGKQLHNQTIKTLGNHK